MNLSFKRIQINFKMNIAVAATSYVGQSIAPC